VTTSRTSRRLRARRWLLRRRSPSGQYARGWNRIPRSTEDLARPIEEIPSSCGCSAIRLQRTLSSAATRCVFVGGHRGAQSLFPPASPSARTSRRTPVMRKVNILWGAAALLLVSSPAGAEIVGICGDVDASGNVVASDALRVLRFAVGQDVTLIC